MCRKTEDESGDSLRPRPVMEWTLTPRDVHQMLTVAINAVLFLFPLGYHHYFHSLASPQLLFCTQETALLTLALRLAVSGWTWKLGRDVQTCLGFNVITLASGCCRSRQWGDRAEAASCPSSPFMGGIQGPERDLPGACRSEANPDCHGAWLVLRANLPVKANRTGTKKSRG